MHLPKSIFILFNLEMAHEFSLLTLCTGFYPLFCAESVLPTCGIPLPLLKYIIYVLYLDVQNLLFCAIDSAHAEVVGNP